MGRSKYERDLRFDPPPPDATDEELEARTQRFLKGMLGGAGYRPKANRKTAKNEAEQDRR